MKTLVLIPTDFEKTRIAPGPLLALEALTAGIEICGFGLIAATAKTVKLIDWHKPDRVVLIGVAGLYRCDHQNHNQDVFQVGQSCVFSRVECYGIGVGRGGSFQSAAELGWDQWQSSGAGNDASARSAATRDIIDLDQLGCSASRNIGSTLLSVTSTSANLEEAREKLLFQPDSVAEDMEGFGVAMACQLCNVPLTIARGFSNWVGDRNHNDWKIAEAMNSACNLLVTLLESNQR